MHKNRWILPIVFIPIILLTFFSCSNEKKESNGRDGSMVEVMRVNFHSGPIFLDLSGKISNFELAEVRARIDGVIQRRLFKEEEKVEVGQQLFQIDSGIFNAKLDFVRAMLVQAKANLQMQLNQYKRYKLLIKDKAISKQLFENSRYALVQAQTEVSKLQAEEKIALINLKNSVVFSPISGVISKSQVDVGTYVQAGAATLLAQIQKIDPIYVDCFGSIDELVMIYRNIMERKLMGEKKESDEVHLLFNDGRKYDFQGSLQIAGITLYQDTGKMGLRVTFPNPKGELLPGMPVRIRFYQNFDKRLMLVPSEAVLFDEKGAKAFLVDESKKVNQVELQLAGKLGEKWIVSSGLLPDDRVIVSNLQNITLGRRVKVLEKFTKGKF